MKKLFCLFSMLLMGIFSGCSLFSPVSSQPQTKYVLDKLPPVNIQKPSRAITLLVAEPNASPIYNTKQIAYRQVPYQIDYFARNSWAERPAEMLHALIMQALQKTLYFQAVISPVINAHYDYILQIQLQELLQDYSHSPGELRLRVRAEIIRTANYQVVAVKQFIVTQPIIACPSPSNGVYAANQASANLIKEITKFCLQSIH